MLDSHSNCDFSCFSKPPILRSSRMLNIGFPLLTSDQNSRLEPKVSFWSSGSSPITHCISCFLCPIQISLSGSIQLERPIAEPVALRRPSTFLQSLSGIVNIPARDSDPPGASFECCIHHDILPVRIFRHQSKIKIP